MVYGCKWYDGLMVDIFVLCNVDSLVYFLKRLLFEGFIFFVQGDWKDELKLVYGEDWFEFLWDRSLDENLDVFRGCEKLKF